MKEKERQKYVKEHREMVEDAQPNLFGLRYLEASAEFAEGSYNEALAKLNELEEDAGSRLNTLVLRAQVHTKLRDYAKAKGDFDRHPSNLKPGYTLSCVCHRSSASWPTEA